MHVMIDYCTFSAQAYGGISRYFNELARGLAHLDEANIRVVAPIHINAYLPPWLRHRSWGIRVPEIRYTGPIRDLVNRPLSSLYAAIYRPDIVHETFYRRPWRRSPRMKTCVTVYDMIHEKFSHLIPPNERDLFERNLQIKSDAVARADLIFCISEHTRKDLMELYKVSADKIRVTHLSAQLPPASDLTSNHSPKNQKPYVLFVGSRGWYKNFDVVLKAFAANERLKSEFDILCFGGGLPSAEESAHWQSLGLANVVRFAQGSDHELAKHYREAAAFIFPSHYEGFGLPLLEAMWADCPLIASNTSCFPEIAGAAAEYFDPTSPEACAESLIRVLYDRNRQTELIQNGHQRRGLFSWERTAAQTLAGYRELL